MAVAVETAGEPVRVVADGDEARPAVPIGRPGRVDVVVKFPVSGEEGARRVDPLQTVDVGDKVGRCRRSVAARRPQETAAADREVVSMEVRQGRGVLRPVAREQVERTDIDRSARRHRPGRVHDQTVDRYRHVDVEGRVGRGEIYINAVVDSQGRA